MSLCISFAIQHTHTTMRTTMLFCIVLAFAVTSAAVGGKGQGGGPPKKSKIIDKKAMDFDNGEDDDWKEKQAQHQADMKAIEALQRILRLCETRGGNSFLRICVDLKAMERQLAIVQKKKEWSQES